MKFMLNGLRYVSILNAVVAVHSPNLSLIFDINPSKFWAAIRSLVPVLKNGSVLRLYVLGPVYIC